jgi:DNA-binding transcriptional ArsR family regulator
MCEGPDLDRDSNPSIDAAGMSHDHFRPNCSCGLSFTEFIFTFGYIPAFFHIGTGVIQMSDKEEKEPVSLEEEVFKALDHQKRRDILRNIGEKEGVTFTEIMNAGKIPDSPTLSYHLRSLAPFVEQRHGGYRLTPMGKDAYSLLLRSTAYDKLAMFQKKRYEATLANLVLWVAAIAAAAYLEVSTEFTLMVMPPLAFVATMITYQLFDEVR